MGMCQKRILIRQHFGHSMKKLVYFSPTLADSELTPLLLRTCPKKVVFLTYKFPLFRGRRIGKELYMDEEGHNINTTFQDSWVGLVNLFTIYFFTSHEKSQIYIYDYRRLLIKRFFKD